MAWKPLRKIEGEEKWQYHTTDYSNLWLTERCEKKIYNRCHLIGYQLTAENANEKNLITGTRYLNVQGMLPFENMAADYVKETGNHVLYRVTPVFEGSNLVASGVLMEAESVELTSIMRRGTARLLEQTRRQKQSRLRRQLLSRPARNPISSIPIQRNFIGRPVHRSNRWRRAIKNPHQRVGMRWLLQVMIRVKNAIHKNVSDI